ncbi:nitroreductase family protein [Lactiplantibacillus sp. WILCCON 0030]|uniref:Nitroreductase family protein n=1 Tax=Lactiplantibacillus brownii TaxID=3069269 RepID=A0ABU1AAK8_9LACO|nr:nitroreductase family protein [Lactiplantibacillus brownii]MDQ7937918.1 nitroreductase family protein [Lactiplantibacillus brownii]
MTINQPINDVIEARHSVRNYDGTTKISQTEMTAMLKLAFLAPSALNLQPIRAMVIATPQIRQQLATATGNKRQLTTASAVVLFVNDRENLAEAQPFLPAQRADNPAQSDIAALDTGLVAMQFMLVAKDHGYDTNPMTGFDHAAFSRILKLDPVRYEPRLLVAIGKAVQPGKGAPHKASQALIEFR